MAWNRTARGVSWSFRTASGLTLAYCATQIRKTQTGVHARVAVTLESREVGYDTFNTERDRERVHLANRVHEGLGKPEQQEVPKSYMRSYMDEFCALLWGHWAEPSRAKRLAGAPEIKPLEFLLSPFLLEASGTIIFAPPGSGKSYTGLLMAASVQHSVSKLWTVRPVNVLYVNLERSEQSIDRRRALCNAALEIDMASPLLCINARGWSLSQVVDNINEAIDTEKVGLIFLDSLSRSGFGDLNENAPANHLMDSLNSTGVAWCALAHTPRADATHIYGSQMFDAAADVVVRAITQKRDSKTMGLGFMITKANDVGPQPMHVVAYEFDQYGLAYVRPAKPGEFLAIEAEEQGDAVSQIQDHLLGVGWDDATSMKDTLGISRQTISTILSKDARFQRRREGNRVLYAIRAKDDVSGVG